MAWKIIQLIDNVLTEVAAIVTSAGSGDSGKIPALDTNGKLDNSFFPTGIGDETKTMPASEDLAAGDFVNVWDDGGTIKARKADASGGAGKMAHGFVLAAVTTSSTATVYTEGINNQLSGLSGGTNYFLSATAGAATATAPTTANYIAQGIGVALSATEISFEPAQPVVRA